MLGFSGSASATEQHTNTISLFGGFGGAVDADEAGYDNLGFQLGYSTLVGHRAEVEVRLGQLGFSSGDSIGALQDPSLSYLTVGAGYGFPETFHKSELYMALGMYRLEGLAFGQDVQESNLGVALGAAGEFDLSRSWVVLVELSGHYLNADFTEFLAMAHVGIGYRF